MKKKFISNALHQFNAYCLALVLRVLVKLRYSIKKIGYEKIKQKRDSNKGILFLVNHTSFVDGVIFGSSMWNDFKAAAVVVDVYYSSSLLNQYIFNTMRAIPFPCFTTGCTDIKTHQLQDGIDNILQRLDDNENVFFFPSGKIKLSPLEELDSASGLYRILQKNPDINIVLVRHSGFWGSMFSYGYDGHYPHLEEKMLEGAKIILKNLLFFTPKRKITFEFSPAPADFPYRGTQKEINRYLHEWYNLPFKTLTPPGEPRQIVPYYFWDKKTAAPERASLTNIEENGKLPEEAEKDIISCISSLTKIPQDQIHPSTLLGFGLELDSLGLMEVAAYIENRYDLSTVNIDDWKTVGDVIMTAIKRIPNKRPVILPKFISGKNYFRETRDLPNFTFSSIDNLQKSFIETVLSGGKEPAISDRFNPPMRYVDIQKLVFKLAEILKHYPEEKLGIFIDPSCMGLVAILASLMAKKIPVVLDWSKGEEILSPYIREQKIQHILTTMSFCLELNQITLGPHYHSLIYIDKLLSHVFLADPFKKWINPRKEIDVMIKSLGLQTIRTDQTALIFQNRENSQAEIIDTLYTFIPLLNLNKEDRVLSTLPFHDPIGFGVGALLPFFSGTSLTLFSPYRTNRKDMINGILDWDPTVVLTSTAIDKLLQEENKNTNSNIQTIASLSNNSLIINNLPGNSKETCHTKNE